MKHLHGWFLIATLLVWPLSAGAQTPARAVSNIVGSSTSYLAATASTNATSVKASAGQVLLIRAFNTTATIYYLRMYNLASAPTCSSATGFVETLPIPASTSGAGFIVEQGFGQTYSTGIAYCITGGAGSTDNTNAAAGVYVTVLHK